MAAYGRGTGRSAETAQRHCVHCGHVLACAKCGAAVDHFAPFNTWASAHAPRYMTMTDVDLAAMRGNASALFEAKANGRRLLSAGQARTLAAMDRQARGYAALVSTATNEPDTPSGHVLDALDVSAEALAYDVGRTPRGVYVVTTAGLDVDAGGLRVNGSATSAEALAAIVALDPQAPDGLDGRTWPDGWPIYGSGKA